MSRRFVAALVMVALGAIAAPAAAVPHRPASPLPLGLGDLSEIRTTSVVQPGVTRTVIIRGEPDARNVWTVEVAVPSGGNGSPDPDHPPTAIADRQRADMLAAELGRRGFAARVEEVVTPAVTDYPGGTLGFRVRIGGFGDIASADTVLNAVRANGYTASRVFTGWDGAAGDRGPWQLQVLTIDPRRLRGSLIASFGPDLEHRETTSALATTAGARAAVNAGFFVLDPKAGAPGDPAGIAVYGGQVFSEATNGRPAFTFRESGWDAGVIRYSWVGSVRDQRGHRLPLDGVNRVPGLIRNCGGTPDDQPTSRPLHDTTCTDADELIAFTPEFGASTPTGPGIEAVLDSAGVVTQIRAPRGGTLPAGGQSVQASGVLVERLRSLAVVGQRLAIRSDLVDQHGRVRHPSRSTMVVNGGPELVRDGRLNTTPAADGMVRRGDPSFYYGWAHKRNPRTIAGVDRAGRIILVTVDGRTTNSLGLSITETATVAKALGMRDAINLDGGGSTTMVIDGSVVNAPSDATGERPVGDAILILPDRRELPVSD